jgi:predicted nucleic acid-binding protein
MVDANILVAGTGWPRFPYEVLRHTVRGDYILVLTQFIIDEAREHIIDLMPEFLDRFEEFLKVSNYEEVPIPTMEEVQANTSLVRDIDDVPVALGAINAEVDYLITQDKDMTDPQAPVHQQLQVILPGTFLRQHMGWASETLEAIRKRTWQEMSDLDD